MEFSKKYLVCCYIIILCFACKNENFLAKHTGRNSYSNMILNNCKYSEPISLVYDKGMYRLFYICTNEALSIFDNNCFNLSSVKSNDMKNWRENSLFMEETNTIVYKGGIILDINNTTGYGTDENPPLIALLLMRNGNDTISDERSFYPVLAYSNNAGDSWSLSDDTTDFPDAFIDYPQNISICWYDPTAKWIMSLGLANYVLFYSSIDLFQWSFESSFFSDLFAEDICWDRTSLISLNDDNHWLLLLDTKSSDRNNNYSGTFYLTGYFDGQNFINLSSKPHFIDYGYGLHSGLVINKPDGQNKILVWKNPVKADSFLNNDGETGLTLFPRLIKSEYSMDGARILSMSPFHDMIEKKESDRCKSYTKIRNNTFINNFPGKGLPFITELKFKTGKPNRWDFPTRFGINLFSRKEHEITIGYDTYFKYFYIADNKIITDMSKDVSDEEVRMPFNYSDTTMSILIAVGLSSIELFANNGQLVMTTTFSEERHIEKMMPFSENGTLDFVEYKILN